MKKIMIIGVVLVNLFMLTSCSKEDLSDSTVVSQDESTANSQEVSTSQDTIDIDDMTYVDQKISTYIKSDSFQNGTLNERLQGMKEILDSLVKDHYLRDYKTYDNGDRPRVEYTYAGGEIGCTLLTELKDDQNRN